MKDLKYSMFSWEFHSTLCIEKRMQITYMMLVGYGYDRRASHGKGWIEKSRKAFQKVRPRDIVIFQ